MNASQDASQPAECFTAPPKEKPLRQAMPQVSAWVDDLRLAFGIEFINGRIKAAMGGEPVFFASENGRSIGTPLPVAGVSIVTDARGIGRVKERA